LLQQALDRAMLAREPLSVLYVDLDHFKQINDRHGHAVGDDCLRHAADAIRRELSDRDVLVRHGGEEFLVVLPNHTTEQARRLAETIRQAVTRLRLEVEAQVIRFTVSIGVASRLGGEQLPKGLVERADRALYAAKRNGRNQVQAAQSYGYGRQDDSESSVPLQ
jgi:diguanylate cyclase (GGDEF)-like protein